MVTFFFSPFRSAHAGLKAVYRFCMQGSFLALERAASISTTPLHAAQFSVPLIPP
ncbi:MAG: hypothetical protein LBI14_09395 [Treponema sp.]|nr:hypothetical protein [Treponema sp.]